MMTRYEWAKRCVLAFQARLRQLGCKPDWNARRNAARAAYEVMANKGK